MKHVLCGLLIVFTGLFVNGQGIMKNANTIVVNNISFDTVVSTLLDKGFYIEKKDKDDRTIKTEPKPIKQNSPILVSMYIRVKDSRAYISGTFTIDGMKDFGISPIQNKGMNGSPLRNSFNYLNQFALSFGKPVEYKIL